MRGVIEGFYGPPWSHAERLDLIAFCGREGFDTWVHAPKDDPYHRKLWREPYPDAELEQLAELVRAAERSGLDFAYAIAPGLDVCYSNDAELETLIGKCGQVQGAGVRSFQLLFDDIEHALSCPEDEERYGGAERPSGAAQADFSNRFREAFDQPGPLVVCPMGYAGTGDSEYRRSFAPALHADDRRVLDRAGGRLLGDQPRGARRDGRALPRPRAPALGQLSRERLRRRPALPRAAARARPAARRAAGCGA